MSSNYWRSVASVLSGTALAQVIPILGSFIIARQYAPTEFGVFSAWLGITMLLGVLLTCRFETALAIEADGAPRLLAFIATLATCLMTACAAGLLLSVCMALGLVSTMLDGTSTLMIVAMVPTGLMLAIAQTWQSWAAAEGRYRALTIMRIVQAATVTVFQIIAGILFSSANALALAHLFGVVASIFASMHLMPFGVPSTERLVPTVRNFWRKHRRFPLFSLPADAINTAAAQLPILIIANRFGAEIAGLLAMTMKILGAPIGLLGKSVLDVFKRHASASFRDKGECRGDYVRTFKVLLLGSIIFCLVMAASSEVLFTLAFGKTWRGAGTIAIWLLPLFALRFMASPLSYMVYIAGKQHVDLIWQIALLGMSCLCLVIPQRYDLALQTYSAGYSLLYVVYLTMSYQFSLGDKG